MKKLAIVTTHPIQYNAPWFRLLSEEPGVDLRVFYTWHAGELSAVDPGFGQTIAWDIPLLDGYDNELVAPSSDVRKRTFWNMDSPGLTKRIHQWAPDTILVIGWNYRAHVSCMRYFHGRIPVWFRGDSTLLDSSSGWKAAVRTLVLHHVYSKIDIALAVGSNNRDYFRMCGVANNQIKIVPHAIDNQRFESAEHDAVATAERATLGISPHEIIILFAGKLEPKKAPMDLVRAYKQATLARSDLRLMIVGAGELESEVRRELPANCVELRLPFQNQTRMPSVYRLGDITCLPSRYNETWGLCLNESMASGRAVIASDRVGACRDLINDKTGWSFRARDVGALRDTLVNLPDRRKLLAMGAESQEFIKAWSFEGIVKEIVRLAIQGAERRPPKAAILS